MGLLGTMVRKDLTRTIRSPLAIGLVLAFPLVFAGMLALVFGSGSGPEIRKVELLVEDRDGSFLSGLLVSAVGSEQMAEYFDVRTVGEEGQGLMEAGEASALLRIPEGFGDDLLAGNTVTLELVRNPAQGILPEIAEQMMLVLTDLLAAASDTLSVPLSEMETLIQGETAATLEDTLSIAAAVHGTIEDAGGLIFPPAIIVESVQLRAEGANEEVDAAGSGTASVFLFVLPGISVWALFLVGDIAMRDVLTESVAGTLRRQLVAPIRPVQIVLGKALYTATLSGISLVLLTVIGRLVAGRNVDPLGFVVLSAAVIVAVTGFASTVYGFARTERQGTTLASVVLLVFAFLGGSFIPIDSLPAGARQLSPFTLFYWGTTGYQQLIRDGAGLVDVLPNIGVLIGVGAALLVVGGMLLGRKTHGVTA